MGAMTTYQRCIKAQERLSARGYGHVGEGSFSVVMRKPDSPVCVKINKHSDAWPLYIHLAMQQGWLGNVAPAVYSIRQFFDSYIGVMEYFPNRKGMYWPERKAYPELISALELLSRLGLANDICADNTALRPNGMGCILDPTGAMQFCDFPELFDAYPKSRIWHPMAMQQALASSRVPATFPALAAEAHSTLSDIDQGIPA